MLTWHTLCGCHKRIYPHASAVRYVLSFPTVQVHKWGRERQCDFSQDIKKVRSRTGICAISVQQAQKIYFFIAKKSLYSLVLIRKCIRVPVRTASNANISLICSHSSYFKWWRDLGENFGTTIKVLLSCSYINRACEQILASKDILLLFSLMFLVKQVPIWEAMKTHVSRGIYMYIKPYIFLTYARSVSSGKHKRTGTFLIHIFRQQFWKT